MTDYSELKRLAEALNRAIAQAEHKPGEWAETAQSMGGICYPGEPFQIGKPWAKEEPWASFSYKRDSWLAVAAVNALPELLELIAENESLRGSCKAMGTDMGKLTRERNSFRSKAEKLSAEIEALRKGLAECATSLEGEMLQKYGGKKPEDMHPVTRRDYDRDMAELAGYRAALGNGERS